MNRRLTLKRDVLRELTDADLGLVGGGAPEPTKIPDTLYSCYDWVSCHIGECLVSGR